jgi:hypothetical protein
MSAPQTPNPTSITKSLGAKGRDWQKLDIRRAATETPPPREFIFASMPARKGMYAMMIGPDGSRKSWLALQVAVGIATGTQIAGGLWPAPKKGKVVYFTSEDGADELWQRVHAISRGQPPEFIDDLDENLIIVPLSEGHDGLTLVCQTKDGSYGQHESVSTLIDISRGARLIMIDPLADALDAPESDDQAAKMLVQTLRSVSRETRAGVLVVHHQNKAAMGGGERHNQTSRGHSKIPSGCRWSVTIQPVSDQEAKQREMMDAPYWTKIYEGKASYAARAIGSSDIGLYHYPETADEHGKTVGGVPLVRLLPVKEGAAGDDAPKPRTGRKRTNGDVSATTRPRRGLANVAGAGADEFDARFADAPLPNIPTTQEDDDDWFK